jgi:glucose/arabinose dehydrogenase
LRKSVVASVVSGLFIMVLVAVSPSADVYAEEAGPDGASDGRVQGRAGLSVRAVANGLSLPWGLAFLPNGDALVSERDSGRLLKVGPGGGVRPVGSIPEAGMGEGGLLGIALSPNYSRDRFVYAYYTTATDNRVVRFRLSDVGTLVPVVTGIPRGNTHNGGRIAFGPDGMLYVATGDAGTTANSQDRSSLGGKILRVTPNGSIPANNPFPGSPVFSLGHRNVQGLAWDTVGRLFATELGQNTSDEVNRIRSGGNYGWPTVEGDGNNPDFIDPIAIFSPANASPSGAAIPKRSDIPSWNGDFFMATLRGQSLYRLELEGNRVTGRARLFNGVYGRLRHVAAAPDGTLWIMTSNGTNDRILRISPR